MPLFAGKKNIGHNIEVEQEAGKPHKQAVAIALNKARGNDDLQPVGDPTRALALKKHEEGITKSQDKRKVKDGGANICLKCDTETDAKMCCGQETFNQNVLGGFMPVRARDIQASEIRTKLGISESAWGALSKEERQKKAMEAVRAKDSTSIGEPTKGGRWGTKSGGETRLTSKTEIERALAKKAKDDVLPVAVRTSRQVPMPAGENNEASYAPRRIASARDRGRFVKSGDSQPPSDMSDGDLEKEIDQLVTKTDRSKLENVRLGFLTDEEVKRKKGKATDSYTSTREILREASSVLDKLERQYKDRPSQRSIVTEATKMYHKIRGTNDVTEAEVLLDNMKSLGGRATDSIATLPVQTSGSEPKDHMLRANQYEVTGDRARALDSYRAAATGYRRANDRANEAKARDGIDACQARFATQYEHPGKGRVKVCDSTSVALRTAIERTRAGEAVTVVGKTVQPQKGRA